MYRRLGKRLFDLALIVLAAPALLPLLAFVALLVRLRLGSPVLFRQIRPGRNGELFELVKFRTMTDKRDPQGNLLPDAERLPRFGRFLRSTSLDELPEIWNILRGEMSLVGPRPLLVEYLPLYNDFERRRHDVVPGVTGWAQINGRNAASWPERFAMDVWYVDHVSLALDVKILARTVSAIVTRRGVTQPGRATVDVFRGSGEE